MVDTSKGGSGNALGVHRSGTWPLVSAQEMQALDRQTIEVLGISGETLMENAGRALVRPTLELRALSTRRSRSGVMIRAFCGPGNNGGDGFVLVRHLVEEGIEAEAILFGDPAGLPAAAAANWKRLESIGAPRRIVDAFDEGEDWGRILCDTSVAIDALFGTGLRREIRGGFVPLIEAFATAREHGLYLLSVDIPSGVEADSGRILGVAVGADRTLTISLPKIGLALEPGRSLAGEITVARVGIMDPDPTRLPRVEVWNALAAARQFPSRPRDGHKGVFGHVLVVAGSKGMMGAASLCALASLRSGSGLVTMAHPGGLSAERSGLPMEVMTAEVAATNEGGFALAAEKAIVELAVARDVVALGPGLGRAQEATDLVRRLVLSIDRPIVLDADGLFGLAGQLELLRESPARLVLTPHPGEAARLLEIEVDRLNADRVGAARQLAERSQSTVVLKGAGTVVADPTGRAMIIPTGGPVLASGGTGDVLTGIVAALLAAGRPAFEAAALGAWWHGATADKLDSNGMGFGVLASEITAGLAGCAAEITDANQLGESGEDLDLRFP